MERSGTSHNKLEEAGMCQKQLQISGTKKNLLFDGRPMYIDSHSVALDSVNFYLK